MTDAKQDHRKVAEQKMAVADQWARNSELDAAPALVAAQVSTTHALLALLDVLTPTTIADVLGPTTPPTPHLHVVESDDPPADLADRILKRIEEDMRPSALPTSLAVIHTQMVSEAVQGLDASFDNAHGYGALMAMIRNKAADAVLDGTIDDARVFKEIGSLAARALNVIESREGGLDD